MRTLLRRRGAAAMMPGERMLRLGDVELAVQTFGDPADPAILLVMGAAASMLHWDEELCAALAAAGRFVVRYDHRDTGRSTTCPPGEPDYTTADLVGDAAGVLDALGLERVHLVGMSMGSELCQQLTLAQPERVISLTLIAGTPGRTAPDGTELPGMTKELAAFFASEEAAGDRRELSGDALIEWLLEGERAFAGSLGQDAERLRDLCRRVVGRSRDVRSGSNHFMVPEGALSQDVSTIAAPTLVVHGDGDPLFPLPHGEALAAAIPGARLLVMEGVGHEVPPPSTYGVFVPALLEATRT